ncbi:hypothetical protein HNY73_007074 [Argiope bruennichi]|uniref:Uncharacterized protein n=1 Tax=Argiope bruennichi TaxID=94029 RepID=A0A8T0FCV1_ARGBR|nr:hypothetical protein HNY73_007074 [Argiope bruennichi]
MSDNEQLITDDNSYSGSDSESEISLNDSGSYESSFSDFSSDEETESSDDLTQVRNFCELDITNPPSPLPRFPFTANPAVHLNIDLSNGTLQFLDIFFDDNLLEIIVSETNKYADRTIRNSNLRRKSRAKKWYFFGMDKRKETFKFCMKAGLIADRYECCKCSKAMKLVERHDISDGFEWRCKSKVYLWVTQSKVDFNMKESKCSSKTVCDYRSYCREVSVVEMNERSVKADYAQKKEITNVYEFMCSYTPLANLHSSFKRNSVIIKEDHENHSEKARKYAMISNRKKFVKNAVEVKEEQSLNSNMEFLESKVLQWCL